MDKKTPEKIVLMCGKGSCCPEATVNEDKSVTLVDNDGPVPQMIHLKPGAAELLRDFLNKKLA